MSINDTTKQSDSGRHGQGARAPGKLILSGEHSVVYGAPALAVAVQHFTEVWFTPLHKTGGLFTAFESLSPSAFYPFEALKSFREGLDRRFDQFLRGEMPVQKILQRPDDLAIYTLTSLLPMIPMPGRSSGLGLPVPGQLSSRTDMPLGAGMGSSAAVVAATIVLYEHLLGSPQSTEDRFEKVRFCERLQHGKGSAIDASAVVFGGLNRVQGDRVTPQALSAQHSLAQAQGWYWVQLGTPLSKTGECVAKVREEHSGDHALWREFEACTEAFTQIIAEDQDPREIIRENQTLLNRIGVVPHAADRFADAVEAMGGAAKVSGAGAVRGEHAGVMLVYQPDAAAMATLMESYPERRWERLRISMAGAHLLAGEAPAIAAPSPAISAQ
ncbi:MAG: GHMP kinase [Pseudomonadota bacterium]